MGSNFIDVESSFRLKNLLKLLLKACEEQNWIEVRKVDREIMKIVSQAKKSNDQVILTQLDLTRGVYRKVLRDAGQEKDRLTAKMESFSEQREGLTAYLQTTDLTV